jgi:hypothetical protein
MRKRFVWGAASKRVAWSLVSLVLAACSKSAPDVAVVSISGGACIGDACRCADTLVTCGDYCFDTQTDEQNCGGCGQACLPSQICGEGACVCAEAQVLCGESCVDTANDTRNCGSCGNACRSSEVCSDGACACPSGQSLCGDSCSDLTTDGANCGSCGNACTGGQECDGGSCACPAGQTACDGQCIETLTDNANCGACGVVCSLGQGCSLGACQSGAPGEDGCQGLAQNISISQIAAYQTVKVPLVQNGAAVATRGTELVAGRDTLVRVFMAPGQGFVSRELSARLYLGNGDETEQLFSESTLTVDGASAEDARDSTFEFHVASELIGADTEFAAEVVECGVGSGAVAQPRFPQNGGARLQAVDAGGLRIHIVPLRANNRVPDTSEAGLEVYRRGFMAAYPISSLELSVGEPLDIADAQDWGGNLDRVRALRQNDGPDSDVYYYGMLRPTETFREFCGNACTAGIGYVPQGRLNPQLRVAMGAAYSDANSTFTMLHEVGHNHGRAHAPCVPQGSSISDVDQQYPYQGGNIGVYAYSSSTDVLLAPDDATDMMGYCRNQWLSDYTYNGLLATVRQVNQTQASEVVSPERIGAWRVALLDAQRGGRWGIPIPGPAAAVGVEEPANVLDASGAVLRTVSVYRTLVSELNGYSVQVPEPQPSWDAIAITGAAPLVYNR